MATDTTDTHDPADPITDASVSVAKCVVGYCDAAEDMIRAQYECVAHDIALSIANAIIDSMGLDPHPLLTPYLSTSHPSENSPTKKPGVTPAGWLGHQARHIPAYVHCDAQGRYPTR